MNGTTDQLNALVEVGEGAHLETMARIERRCAQIAALEHGRRYFSSEELAIIYHREMPYEEKWWRVSAIRQARSAKRARRHQQAHALRTARVIPFERTAGLSDVMA